MILTKDLSLANCNIKLQASPGTFSGYASVFNGNDSYNDTIVKGAFTKTLLDRKRAPVMLFGHDSSKVIGKWIGMSEDDNGLLVKGEFTPGHTEAMNVLASMRHGAIDGLSIGFRIPKGGSDEKDDGGRIIKEIDLVETSIVTFPADLDARVSVVKQEIDKIKSLKDAEYFLREAEKFSKATARDFVSVIMREAKKALLDKQQALNEQHELGLLIQRIKSL